jgi:hypothetical protein
MGDRYYNSDQADMVGDDIQTEVQDAQNAADDDDNMHVPITDDIQSDSDSCWLCTYCMDPLARDICLFIVENIIDTDVKHLAPQIQLEILKLFPSARGINLKVCRISICMFCWTFDYGLTLNPKPQTGDNQAHIAAHATPQCEDLVHDQEPQRHV